MALTLSKGYTLQENHRSDAVSLMNSVKWSVFLMGPIGGDVYFHHNIKWYFLSFSAITVHFKMCD